MSASSNKLLRILPNADQKLVVDTWAKQSDLMWRTVYATPAIATAIFAGWYIVWDKGQGNAFLANSVLGVGIIMMMIQGLIIHRMARYLNVLRRAAGSALPYVEPSRIFPGGRFSLPLGNQLAVAVPAILIVLFLIMLVLSLLGL